MPLVDTRYAKALFDIALDEGALDAYREELSLAANILLSDASFEAFLHAPSVKRDKKKQVIRSAFQGNVKPYTLSFLLLLLDKDRITELPDICREFNRYCDEAKHVLNICIISSYPLGPGQVRIISEKFQKRYNADSVNYETKVDPSLLGGIKVAVGDKLYDASLKEQLSELRSAMLA